MKRFTRRGLTRIDVLALMLVFGFVFFTAAVSLSQQQVVDNAVTCRNRMRNVAMAIFNYSVRNASYPGYMNALQRTDGRSYVDPETNEPAPVSWAVVILPDIDRVPLFDAWRNPNAGNESYRSTPIDLFLCPEEYGEPASGPATSFVVNTGMPDVAAGTPASAATRGLPRDWAANGVFFDNYTSHPLINTNPATRAPMEIMRDERIRDPKDHTILLTENIDAVDYLIRGKTQAADHWKAVEVQTGCIWQRGPIDLMTAPPTMTPPAPSLQVNVDAGKGDGEKFEYCRPSSKHAGGVNVAFVGQNVAFINEKISYFVFAKLMASDDENIRAAGSLQPLDDALRHYQFIQGCP